MNAQGKPRDHHRKENEQYRIDHAGLSAAYQSLVKLNAYPPSASSYATTIVRAYRHMEKALTTERNAVLSERLRKTGNTYDTDNQLLFCSALATLGSKDDIFHLSFNMRDGERLLRIHKALATLDHLIAIDNMLNKDYGPHVTALLMNTADIPTNIGDIPVPTTKP